MSLKYVVPLCGAVAMAALSASAQQARPPGPTDATAPVPVVKYESAFADYRPFAEEKVAPWRESNETVKGGGGHAGHGARPPAPPTPAAKPPATPDHGGHR